MSSKIIISAEASCDLPKELVEKYDVRIMPATVIVGDDILHDGEIEGEDLFRYFETTGKLPRTSATNVNEFDSSSRRPIASSTSPSPAASAPPAGTGPRAPRG